MRRRRQYPPSLSSYTASVSPSASRPGKQHEIAIRVLHDEVARAPRHELERLEERDAGGLEFEKETLDLVGGFDATLGRQEPLALAIGGVDDRTIDAVENERRSVARNVGIEGRLAIEDRNLEAELLSVEVTRRFDVGDEQLRKGGREHGSRRGSFCCV